ncbi:MAG: VOC family protein [Deltaproteobacteria bacterium]|nr:VOC family protein [Deltaproteobacteria bacterium]
MSGKVTWFEVMGQDPVELQSFYSELFGWELNAGPGWPDYGMIDPPEGGGGIAGGIGKTPVGTGWTTFYVDVDDLEAALAKASSLGAEALLPPKPLPGGSTIAQVKDPEGHVLGLVKAAA